MAILISEIDPVALSIGPIQIRWYALAYLGSFLLGWQYALYLCGLDRGKEPKDKFIQKTSIDDFLPWMILGVILGGRLGYVLFYQLEMFVADPWEIPKIWHGGMSFHGGVCGVIVTMLIYSYYYKLPLFRLTDIVACAVPIGLFFGRIANFINGELFGRPSTMPWSVIFPHGGPYPRHPSQLYEAALEGLVLFLVLFLLARNESIRNRAGFLSGLFLIGYGTARILVEFFREPDLQIGLIADFYTLGQVLCLPMILGGCLLIFLSHSRNKVKPT